MSEKLKFKPVITRIKLNPEQAVLACSCWDRALALSTTGSRTNTNYCQRYTRTKPNYNKSTTTASVS